MFYLDTSFIIASLTRDEVRSDDARAWLDLAAPAALIISDWVKTEIASALSFKVRTGQLSVEDRAAVLVQWRSLESASLSVMTVQPNDFETAALFAERYELSLRAGDALHIAIAHGAGCTLVTLDKRMADAAIEVGVPVAAIER